MGTTKMKQLTEVQVSALGDAHHRGELIRCPICETPLLVGQRGISPGRKGVALVLTCRRCRETWFYEPVGSGKEWTEAQKAQIIDDYWKRGDSRCPNDRAHIDYIVSDASESNFMHASCPICATFVETTS